MAAYASFLPSPPLPLRPLYNHLLPMQSLSLCRPRLPNYLIHSRPAKTLVVVSSSSSFAEFNWKDNDSLHSKRSVLSNLIQEIEPLDVSFIQKGVSPTTLDAMKRTISGMLGLLPSNQFQVLIEAFWEPLSKLLVSSIMTGYTLRNADCRLYLERSLVIHEENDKNQKGQGCEREAQSDRVIKAAKSEDASVFENLVENASEDIHIQGLGEISLEAQQYILSLQRRLSSVKGELHEVKRRSAALRMQQFVGEEKNDLLDYLRSLQPEKVAELSEPTCPELKETIHSVVHGLLATLSPRMHSKAPHMLENMTDMLNVGTEEGCFDLVGNPSVKLQPLVSLTRDYLARLLFWCMLLGHYLRGLEYRLELMELLSLPGVVHRNTGLGDQSA